LKNFSIAVCLLYLFATAPAMADMRILLQDGQYGNTGGGEFLITVLDDPIGIYPKNAQFMTFCLETNEYVSYNTQYNVTISTSASEGGRGGGNPDPLSPKSAFLYSLWLDGTYGSYAIAAYNDDSANALQRAIWFIENEGTWGSDSGLSGDYIDWATDAVAPSGSWFNTWGANSIGDIRVMNLWTLQGGYAQDQFVRVPVPGAVFLGMLGLSAAGLKLRRFA